SSQRTPSTFFFQAEDGIRDFHVTGVQTCALPIWRTPTAPDHRVSLELTDAEYARCTAAAARAHQPLDTWMREQILAAARRRDPRSEERRVGKGQDPRGPRPRTHMPPDARMSARTT